MYHEKDGLNGFTWSLRQFETGNFEITDIIDHSDIFIIIDGKEIINDNDNINNIEEFLTPFSSQCKRKIKLKSKYIVAAIPECIPDETQIALFIVQYKNYIIGLFACNEV